MALVTLTALVQPVLTSEDIISWDFESCLVNSKHKYIQIFIWDFESCHVNSKHKYIQIIFDVIIICITQTLENNLLNIWK